jgi:type I restriction enzyme, S subunit
MRWTDCDLGDVVTLKRGHDLPKGKRHNGIVPVVSSSGITGWHNEVKAEPPGVVTGRYGTIGEVFYLDRPYWPLNTALYAIDFHGNDPKFVAYFLRNQLKNYKSEKAAVPGVDRKVLHKIKVRCPDSQSQERIVAILSAYDDLIENNWRRIALSEQAARLLYREWFVHFSFPGHETAKFVDGLPEGWEIVTYGDLFSFLGGFMFKSSTYIDDGRYGVCTIKNVHDGKFIEECPSRIADIPPKMKPHCRLETGDVLLSLTGNVGRACIVVGNDYLLNQRVAKIVGKIGIPNSFVYWTFSNSRTIQDLENLAHGVAQLNLSPIELSGRPFCRPPSNLLEQFNDQATPLLEQIVSLTKQVSQLTRARDLLLPRLMDGRISV